MGAMWSDESEEEKPKSRRSRVGTKNKSSFFDDFSFSEIDEPHPAFEEEEELEEEEEPIYVAPLPISSLRKRAPKNKSSKSVRFAKRRGTKRNGY